MKKKIWIIILLLSVFVVSVAYAAREQGNETGLCTEENGINHELEYLHELAAYKPYKAREYLGKPISFTAPFASVEEDVKLAYYGSIKRLLIFSVPEGRCFWVEDSGANELYAVGELLHVSGRITSITPERIMLLDVIGTPGYPNDIKIERAE